VSSETEITVRQAELGDVAELSALAQRTWSDAFGAAFTPEDQTADAEARRSEAFFAAALADSVILVAQLDGVMVGYAKCGPVGIPEAHAGEGDRELHRLYVERTRVGSQQLQDVVLMRTAAHPSR
jgi:hypothetical protein